MLCFFIYLYRKFLFYINPIFYKIIKKEPFYTSHFIYISERDSLNNEKLNAHRKVLLKTWFFADNKVKKILKSKKNFFPFYFFKFIYSGDELKFFTNIFHQIIIQS